ncbi:3,4-dihydroxy-2-butanone 4-phosphate synthase / GTP cyclohydrolase II [Thioalkalivibrio nitratireducens DSM 14787]|uniref:GTP cyclohydrolase II n=1 Tax=Thioalkalivibrio nitratireducens (strain DSM 14787 / UNIQEM 213 / ALEN2) TaxID=1255043 RepID=L0DTQ7_THIND|nr:GTP cyclohydrolase II [Thioalkalivibrio nitratireducens]AGA32989.1 3,4-dihydroxy-2-butanone 4-phosphate synthase / GTP cyclohydrolase II [Thioalkalivibrio nitratireducens DSM 14787]
MFTYIDPSVRARLLAQGKLERINADGRRIDATSADVPAEPALDILGPIALPVAITEEPLTAQWYAFVRRTELARVQDLATELREKGGQHLFASLTSSMAVNSLLEIGNPDPSREPLVRVHSNCLTGDVFGSRRCDCGPQLAAAIRQIQTDPAGGYLVYMAGHEGRGIGLWAKAATYLLQDAGENTYQANRSLGLPDDSRDFTDAASILKWKLGDRPFRLLTNNPKKLQDLAEHGLTNARRVKHLAGVDECNRRYLRAKRTWGHAISEEDLHC